MARGSLRRTKRQRVFGLAEDPWNEQDVWHAEDPWAELRILGSSLVAEDPWSERNKIGCLFLAEDSRAELRVIWCLVFAEDPCVEFEYHRVPFACWRSLRQTNKTVLCLLLV